MLVKCWNTSTACHIICYMRFIIDINAPILRYFFVFICFLFNYHMTLVCICYLSRAAAVMLVVWAARCSGLAPCWGPELQKQVEAAPLVGPPGQSALKQPGRSSLLHLRQQKAAHFSLLRNDRKGRCLFSTASFIATVKNEHRLSDSETKLDMVQTFMLVCATHLLLIY